MDRTMAEDFGRQLAIAVGVTGVLWFVGRLLTKKEDEEEEACRDVLFVDRDTGEIVGAVIHGREEER